MQVTIPNQISNGNPNDGDQVQENFDALADVVPQLVAADGSTAMQAPLVLHPNDDSDGGNVAATRDHVAAVAGLVSGIQVARRGSTEGLVFETIPLSKNITFDPPFTSVPTVVATTKDTPQVDGLHHVVIGSVSASGATLILHNAGQAGVIAVDWIAIGESV